MSFVSGLPRGLPHSPKPPIHIEPCLCPCLWHLCTHFPAPCAPNPLPLANMLGVAQVPSSPPPALHEQERSCSVKNSGFPRALMDFWSVCKTHPTTQPTALQPGGPREPCLPPQLGPWGRGLHHVTRRQSHRPPNLMNVAALVARARRPSASRRVLLGAVSTEGASVGLLEPKPALMACPE